ncbi:hypothetical protein UM594_10145 [Staphylococcus aureus]|nr:hypothetical protein UM594_10145 [Staphylococcus aureus]
MDKATSKHGYIQSPDNLSDEEKELIKLRKEVQHLKMENDILKQVALIMGQNRSHSKECTSIFSISNV